MICVLRQVCHNYLKEGSQDQDMRMTSRNRFSKWKKAFYHDC